jgi:CheY-like chemotaxis protein
MPHRASNENQMGLESCWPDDAPDILEGVAALLEPEFEVVGRVKDGLALIEAARSLVPDLIVADIAMPVLNGFQARSRRTDPTPASSFSRFIPSRHLSVRQRG